MRLHDLSHDEEPTAADLAAIEREMPVIEAEVAVVDAEIAMLRAVPGPSPLDWRRLRRAQRRVIRAFVAVYGEDPADFVPLSEVA